MKRKDRTLVGGREKCPLCGGIGYTGSKCLDCGQPMPRRTHAGGELTPDMVRFLALPPQRRIELELEMRAAVNDRVDGDPGTALAFEAECADVNRAMYDGRCWG